jgi:hypothetical protein
MTWTWVRATCRGTSHVASDAPCQDFSFCEALGVDGEFLVAVASDGAGSASHSQHGSALLCRTMALGARAHFCKSSDLPTEGIAWSWVDEARDRIRYVAEKSQIEFRQFAATLVCAIVGKSSAVVLHIGDGAAVVSTGGVWSVASWPENGEYASATYFVTDDPTPRLRFVQVDAQVDAIAVFTDGIERLALDFHQRRAHAPFFEAMLRPVQQGDLGRNHDLSKSLADYLNGAAINSRTDDDKSLILASRK